MTLAVPALQLAQRLPARIRRGGSAVTGTDVQLGPARWTQPSTVIPAQRVTGNVQQPLLAQRGTQIELRVPLVEQENVGIILEALCSRFREDQVRLFRHVARRIAQTAATGQLHIPLDRTMPVEPARAGC